MLDLPVEAPELVLYRGDVHASAMVAYDNAVKSLPALPGENESAVLDSQMETAINKIRPDV